MQNSPSQVRTGNISPTISGPHKDKDALVVSGLVVSLAAAIGAFWYFSSTDPRVGDQLDSSTVTEMLKDNQPVAVSVPVAHLQTAAAVAAPQPGAIHADLYFEVGRKGLSDEARKELQEDAALLKGDENLGVLIQGYTDQQGSAGYNLTLGLKRAEAVKTELVRAGVAEHQIKVVSLGKDGALCIDSSDVCRRMNRRVHLEIRPIGREHMMSPAVAVTTQADLAPASADSGKETGDAGLLSDSVLPAANASPGTHNGPSAFEPASGS
jgi:peptidoglycan-associated lipoprotein